MPLNLAYRGGAVLRTVRLNVLSCPVRVAAIHIPTRRASLATTGRLPSPLAAIAYPSVFQSGKLANSYATAAEKRKTTSKTSKTSKGRKTAKKSRSTASAKTKAPKKRRELSERQKKLREARKEREYVEQLKATALTPPKRLPERMSALAIQDKMPEAKEFGLGGQAQTFVKAVELTKTMSSEERERFQAMAESNRAANAEAFDKWLKSHTPLQIKQANLARRRLSNLKGKKIAPLHDERAVRKVMTSYAFYMKERINSGDLKHMLAMDIGSQVAQEWRGMTDAEKEKYQRMQAADVERYIREYHEVYGEAPPFTRKSTAKAA